MCIPYKLPNDPSSNLFAFDRIAIQNNVLTILFPTLNQSKFVGLAEFICGPISGDSLLKIP